jgi:hypothetical protein
MILRFFGLLMGPAVALSSYCIESMLEHLVMGTSTTPSSKEKSLMVRWSTLFKVTQAGVSQSRAYVLNHCAILSAHGKVGIEHQHSGMMEFF